MIKKEKSKKKSLVIMYIILGISIAGILTFGIWLGVDHYLDRQSQNFYTSIVEGIEIRPRSSGSRAVAQSPAENEDESSDVQSSDEVREGDWVSFVDFDELAQRFSGIIGWIRLEGTAINYPIMQGTDNSFFLYHLPDGTRHRSGSIFMDFRNAPDFSDRNTILYGHMSRTDDMFGALKYFRRQEFYDANYVMYIHTPERDYQLVIFAVHLVNSAVEQPRITFRDDEHFSEYLSDIRSRSMVSSDVEVSVDDKIVTLATCAYDFTNARLVVIGKLVQF
jgi:sortase B